MAAKIALIMAIRLFLLFSAQHVDEPLLLLFAPEPRRSSSAFLRSFSRDTITFFFFTLQTLLFIDAGL